MRYMLAFMGIILIFAWVTAGEIYKPDLDIDTYVDANNASASFSNSAMLWASSEDNNPIQETYLSFVNLFESQGISKPDQIKSAELALKATDVKTPGKIVAYFVEGAALSSSSWDFKPEFDPNLSASASIIIDDNNSYTMDVTPIIKKAVEVCTKGCPYSIVLIAKDNASIGFASNEIPGMTNTPLKYVTQ